MTLKRKISFESNLFIKYRYSNLYMITIYKKASNLLHD